MSLSDRLRPNCEAAPWVIDEVKELETYCAYLRELVGEVLDATVNASTYPDGPCLPGELRERLQKAITRVARRPQSEIESEIHELESITASQSSYDRAMIEVAVCTLRQGINTATSDWNLLTADQQELSMVARAWAEGVQDERPSAVCRKALQVGRKLTGPHS